MVNNVLKADCDTTFLGNIDGGEPSGWDDATMTALQEANQFDGLLNNVMRFLKNVLLNSFLFFPAGYFHTPGY